MLLLLLQLVKDSSPYSVSLKLTEEGEESCCRGGARLEELIVIRADREVVPMSCENRTRNFCIDFELLLRYPYGHSISFSFWSFSCLY